MYRMQLVSFKCQCDELSRLDIRHSLVDMQQ